MKGALMLESSEDPGSSELAEDRQAHAGGFTKARVMTEAQPDSCFLDYHTVITKLIKSGEVLHGIS